MSIWRLRLSMALCAIATIGIGTLVLYGIMLFLAHYMHFMVPPILAVAAFVLVLAVLQWLFAPKIIEAVYHVREADPIRYPWLYEIVDELCSRSGITRRPKVMIADIPIPNAFAYGSPITGNRVALTTMLLKTLSRDEIKAVLGHEVGHLKHRDVAWMLAIATLPMLIYYIGDVLFRGGLLSSMLGGHGSERGAAALLLLIGAVLLGIAFLLNIFVLAFSRYREYFADRHSVRSVPNGGRLLQRALAKIVLVSRYGVEPSEPVKFTQFKALFIQDPFVESKSASYWWRNIDEFIEHLKRSPITLSDRIKEVFSTHPNVKKRLIMLDKFEREFWA